MNLQEAVEMWKDCKAPAWSPNCDACSLYYREFPGELRICSHLSAAASLLRKQAQPKVEVKQ